MVIDLRAIVGHRFLNFTMKLNYYSAQNLALKYLSDQEQKFGGVPYSIVESGVIEDEQGWHFPYQSVEFLTTGDFNASLVGNWPIFVSRDGLHVGPRRPDIKYRNV